VRILSNAVIIVYDLEMRYLGEGRETVTEKKGIGGPSREVGGKRAQSINTGVLANSRTIACTKCARLKRRIILKYKEQEKLFSKRYLLLLSGKKKRGVRGNREGPR